MPLLTKEERDEVWEALMEEGRFPPSVLKRLIRRAVDDVDQWVEDNQSSFNQALPAAFRTAANPVQKMEILAFVLKKRIGEMLNRRRSLGGGGGP